MITRKENEKLQEKTCEFLKKCGVSITAEEKKGIEVVDHGFGCNQQIMTQIVVYVNNDIYCAKELILFPWEIVPEHRHPPVGNYRGKQETFRCRFGEVYLYVPGRKAKKPKAKVPKEREKYFTAWNEIVLKPGQQYTLAPDTLHWFQSGPEGALVSEFSSRSIDDHDIFTDPGINRITEIR